MDRSSEEYNKKWFVLMHLLRDHALYVSTKDKLERMKYFEEFVEYHAVYAYIKDYCEELHQAPKEASVLADFDNSMAYYDVPSHLRTVMQAKVRRAYAMKDEAMDRSIIEFYVANEYTEFLTTSYHTRLQQSEVTSEDLYTDAKTLVEEVDKCSYT